MVWLSVGRVHSFGVISVQGAWAKKAWGLNVGFGRLGAVYVRCRGEEITVVQRCRMGDGTVQVEDDVFASVVDLRACRGRVVKEWDDAVAWLAWGGMGWDAEGWNVRAVGSAGRVELGWG